MGAWMSPTLMRICIYLQFVCWQQAEKRCPCSGNASCASKGRSRQMTGTYRHHDPPALLPSGGGEAICATPPALPSPSCPCSARAADPESRGGGKRIGRHDYRPSRKRHGRHRSPLFQPAFPAQAQECSTMNQSLSRVYSRLGHPCPRNSLLKRLFQQAVISSPGSTHKQYVFVLVSVAW